MRLIQIVPDRETDRVYTLSSQNILADLRNDFHHHFVLRALQLLVFAKHSSVLCYPWLRQSCFYFYVALI